MDAYKFLKTSKNTFGIVFVIKSKHQNKQQNPCKYYGGRSTDNSVAISKPIHIALMDTHCFYSQTDCENNESTAFNQSRNAENGCCGNDMG